ncbi:hypothetical protein SI65_00208 [Aspergillus cristatus]|uniref:FAD-dependent oxidoreductase 2 FAD-binding domain-containing protein n=1 Tax=Aspergillus cristatus TaxID=573508 RepID=A0A1E3BNU4_ASPCR|nr:hypothetical protein SI65_00208 [Aspergillus cristatus]
MACAAFVAQSGARVLVVEKQDTVGGSSNYSAGMFWAPQTYDKLRSWVPDGGPELQRAWLNEYLPAVQWMRENQVPIAERFDGIMTIGIGFPIQIPHLHSLHRKRIESSKTGSDIWTNTSIVKLIQESPCAPGSRINGAIVRRVQSSGRSTPYVTYGGINIDKQGHALTADKTIIPELLVAGVDAGGFSNLGYAGGLALAFVMAFGQRERWHENWDSRYRVFQCRMQEMLRLSQTRGVCDAVSIVIRNLFLSSTN